jgi:cyclopropane fatty-acyl-phospholipid synthase-like methyltransferase
MDWNITDSEELEDTILKLKLKLVQKIGVHHGMTVVDMGCGQGGFTTSLAKTVGKKGKVSAVDVSDEYLTEFMDRLNKHGVKDVVTFIQADAVNLKDVLPNESADVVASYRLLEELKQPKAMAGIVKEMARIVKEGGGRIGIVELCTEPRNEAEEAYIRLHRESGDSLFEPPEIIEAMKAAKLADIRVEKVETDIWFSPDLAKQDLSHAQVWFDANVEKSLGKIIDKHGMKYPAFLIFSGIKN